MFGPEREIKQLSRPETSDEHELIAQASEKRSNGLPLPTSQIHEVSDLLYVVKTSQLQTFIDSLGFYIFTS